MDGLRGYYLGRTNEEIHTFRLMGRTVPIAAEAAPGHGDSPRRHTRPISTRREPRGQPKRSVAMPLKASSYLGTFKMKTSRPILRVKKVTRSSAVPAGAKRPARRTDRPGLRTR